MMQPWFLVLIETLWNVNSYVTGHKWRRQGINRNIVECKLSGFLHTVEVPVY